MAVTNKQLVAYAKGQIGRPYWFGTYGQKATRALYEAKKKQYPKYYTAKDFDDQIKAGKRVHDCSGLIKGALMTPNADPNGVPKYNSKFDVGSDTMLKQCKEKGKIATIPEIEGVLVFKKGHVGVYIGKGKVVEAKGHKWGVIESKLAGAAWTDWGKHKDITYIVDKPVEKPAESTSNDVLTGDVTNYTVTSGDTLTSISKRFGVNVSDLISWNNISDPNVIQNGQVIKIKGNYMSVTASKLNVRSTPNGKIIAVITKGTFVKILGTSGDWKKVSVNGHNGYCFTKYLRNV